jgi:ABC-2 type transport system ATP-binding protein
MTPIAFKHLTKAVGGTTVLHDLTWTVPPGAFCGLLGRNGAGKTVLLQTAMGLLLPDAGDALVLGHPLAVGCPEAKREVGYVPQDTWLPPWARVKDVMGVERAARRHWDGQAVERWLRQEGIPSRRPLTALSGGQRKRLELQLVLAARPRVLLMDEPLPWIPSPRLRSPASSSGTSPHARPRSSCPRMRSPTWSASVTGSRSSHRGGSPWS